ncbi:hypothetical protein ANN_17424 [Periplaneta americana]|uniref:Uncharacterized protein n=1 Tax=Periplaneta americana TaxID=6978 RepID=A0ABQ8SU41_PERAM|nr:hypothetical protein ANN_17424 [Periplaneta americana]
MVGLCEGGNEPPGFLKVPPAWLSRLRHLPAGLKLRSGADRCKPIRMSIAMASIEKHVYYVIQLTTRSAVIVEESERCGGEAWASQQVLCSSEASFETGVRLECVRSCVSVRSPEFEYSGSQLEDLSSKFSGLSLKVWGSRYCELE